MRSDSCDLNVPFVIKTFLIWMFLFDSLKLCNHFISRNMELSKKLICFKIDLNLKRYLLLFRIILRSSSNIPNIGKDKNIKTSEWNASKSSKHIFTHEYILHISTWTDLYIQNWFDIQNIQHRSNIFLKICR